MFENYKIIQNDKINGSVNVMEGEDDANVKFRMYERIAVKNYLQLNIVIPY